MEMDESGLGILACTDDGKTRFAELGFRMGEKGTHMSRTIMFQELSLLFHACDLACRRDDYMTAIVEDNCLAKQTLSTRQISAQRMRELYGLDPGILIFQKMRHLWEIDEIGRPLLAILTCLARDPILRVTAGPILHLNPGKELRRQKMTEVLSESLQERLNESTIDKVVRNASSSWTQSGHLKGRMRKVRQRVSPTPVVATFSLLLGYFLGYRGESLFETFWTQIVDMPKAQAMELAVDAKRLGLLEMTQAGGVVYVSFPELLSEKERRLLHGTS
jgi:hypothetical protein